MGRTPICEARVVERLSVVGSLGGGGTWRAGLTAQHEALTGLWENSPAWQSLGPELFSSTAPHEFFLLIKKANNSRLILITVSYFTSGKLTALRKLVLLNY